MSNQKTGMDADMVQVTKRATRRRKDFETLDIFTGSPDGEPPPKPLAVPKGHRLVLEEILAKEEVTPEALRASPPADVKSGSISGALDYLVRKDLIEYRIPDSGYEGVLCLRPTAKAWAWLRKTNEAENRSAPPKQKPPRPDRETQDAFAPTSPPPPPSYEWFIGRMRILALKEEHLSVPTFFASLLRDPDGPEEIEAAEAKLGNLASRGWIRKLKGKFETLPRPVEGVEDGRLFPVYFSLIREV